MRQNLNSLLIVNRINSVSHIKDLNSQILELEKSNQENIEINSWYHMLPYEIIGHKLNSQLKLSDLNGGLANLEDLFQPSGNWVFRYFNKTCSSCYEKSINTLRVHFDSQSGFPFSVWTDFENTEDIKNFVSKTHWECDVFAVNLSYDFEAEELQFPYLFFIDGTGTISNCFVIQKDRLGDLIQFLNLTFPENEK